MNQMGRSSTQGIVSRLPEADLSSDVAKLMTKAVIQPGFDKKSAYEVAAKSRNQLKKERKNERMKTAGDGWQNMPATELTEENKRDLELLQMRDALDPKTHYRKTDRGVLPKYFEVGRVIETKADWYSSRLTKRERKPTMIEELMNDHELIAKNKKRYDDIMRRQATTRRGAFQRGGYISKHSQRKKMAAKRK